MEVYPQLMRIHNLLIHLAGQFLKRCHGILFLYLFRLLTILRLNNLIVLPHKSDHLPVYLMQGFGLQLLIFPKHQIAEVSLKDVPHGTRALFLELLGVRVQGHAGDK